MKKSLIIFLVIFFTSTLSSLLAKENLPNDIKFNVYRNNNLIGYHKVVFSSNNDFIESSIEIKFEVRFLGFVVYDYFHKNTEIWRENSLVNLNAHTDKNGENLNCNYKKSDHGFLIKGSSETKSLSDAAISTSYWNKILVEKNKRKVLNTQDCSQIDFIINDLGEEKIYGNSLSVNHYKLLGNEISGELVDIDIWYNQSNEWVKMIFVKDGSKIEYILEQYDSDQ